MLQCHGGIDQLALREIPEPGMMPHNEVRIEVHAAGVNPFDVKLRNGVLQHRFPVSPGHILGCDVAGIVTERGFDVSHVEVGDRVYGLLDPMRSGSYAESVVAPSWLVRRAPKSLSFEQTAAVPMAGCTAWVALSELTAIRRGARVLVTGAGGGVGSFVIQLAKHFGAYVTAIAAAEKHEYVLQLGADDALDYSVFKGSELHGLIDVIIDTKGGQTNLECVDALVPGGVLLSVRRDDECAMRLGERRPESQSKIVVFDARPGALEQLGALFDAGELRAPDLRVFPLEQFASAHELMEAGRACGKIVLKVR